MNSLVPSAPRIAPMSMEDIDKVRRLETEVLKLPQVDIFTQQLLHAGMYARTMFVPAGVVVTGSYMKCATILIIQGEMKVYIGAETLELKGYNVIPAGPNRKQAGYAITDTYVTMLFPTEVKTVEEAEAEFTDEVDKLMSRNGGSNTITITGE